MHLERRKAIERTQRMKFYGIGCAAASAIKANPTLSPCSSTPCATSRSRSSPQLRVVSGERAARHHVAEHAAMRPHFFQLALTLPEEIRLPRRVAGLPLWLDACGWTPVAGRHPAASSRLRRAALRTSSALTVRNRAKRSTSAFCKSLKSKALQKNLRVNT